MWTCPKCSREFKNKGQNHSCGVKPGSVDEYISSQSEEIQPILFKVRETIRTAAPDAVEKIAWQMPTYWQSENLIHFAAQKKHLGIHPGYLERIPFKDRFAAYKTSKGAIQFPYDKPVDYELIADIVRWRVSCVEGKKMIDEAIFFDKKPDMLPLYEAVRNMICTDFDGVKVKVQKTQNRIPLGLLPG
jgi:uncharacterized protein YdhG (YjbR/CyaY superfamily)